MPEQPRFHGFPLGFPTESFGAPVEDMSYLYLRVLISGETVSYLYLRVLMSGGVVLPVPFEC